MERPSASGKGLTDGVELDPVHEGVVVNRARVRGTTLQGLQIDFAGAPEVVGIDGGERDQLYRLDLDHAQSDRVLMSRDDLRRAPQPEGHRDHPRQDVLSQLPTELHPPTLAPLRMILESVFAVPRTSRPQAWLFHELSDDFQPQRGYWEQPRKRPYWLRLPVTYPRWHAGQIRTGLSCPVSVRVTCPLRTSSRRNGDS